MTPEVAAQLVGLNHRFYQSFAGPFSETRLRLQPGVARLLERIPPEASVLDLGCGGGALAAALVTRRHRGPYLGLDFSAGLLDEARAAFENSTSHQEVSESQGCGFDFRKADLSSPSWIEAVPQEPFDFILAFAVLHHMPGKELRLQLLTQTRSRLAAEGQFLHSNWQFLNSERLRQRIKPWAQVGITPDEVDPGDALLDWRRGGEGLRYAHHFRPEELELLAELTDFDIQESFYSDGQGGDLGLYQVWVLNQDL